MNYFITLSLLLFSFHSFSQTDSADTDDSQEIDLKYIDRDEVEADEEVFEMFQIEVKAKFNPNGHSGLQLYIAENFEYPDTAVIAGVGGVVKLEWTVNKDGSVSNVRTASKPIGYGIEDEAIRVIQSTSGMWTPAKARDRPVRSTYGMPLNLSVE